MIKMIAALLVLLILCEGCGQWIADRFRFELHGYGIPLGAAAVFALLELLDLPVLLLHLEVVWSHAAVLFAFICCMLVVLAQGKKTVSSLLQKKSLYGVSAAILIILLFHSENDSLRNALVYASSKTSFSLQGFTLFPDAVQYFAGVSDYETALILILFSSMVSSALVLNIIESLHIENQFFRFILIIFSIFYGGFEKQCLLGGYTGRTWRLTFTVLLIFTAYQWIKEDRQEIKKAIPIVIAAGLFSDRSFAFISTAVIYCLLVYLLANQKVRSLYDTMSFLEPLIVYLAACLFRHSHFSAWILLLIYAIILLFRGTRKNYHRLIKTEDFLIAYNRRIFYLAVPCIFLTCTALLRIFVPGYEIEYADYIQYFSRYESAGFLFPTGSVMDIIIDILRWAGLTAFLIHERSNENRMIKFIIAGMLVFFINPLCMGMLAKITGYEMYAGAFEVLFNPFTDILFFSTLYKVLKKKAARIMMEIVLIFCIIAGHTAGFAGMKTGLYTDLLERKAVYECI